MTEQPAPVLLNLHGMAEHTGATAQQINTWTYHGLLHPEPGTTGEGRRRMWSAGERDVCARMVTLTRLGLRAGPAAEVARGEPRLSELARVLATIATSISTEHLERTR
jgi:hypothetical protein